MEILALKFKCPDGQIRTMQSGCFINMTDGFSYQEHELKLVSVSGDEKTQEKIPDRFFDLTDRLMTINEVFINELKQDKQEILRESTQIDLQS